MAPGAERAEACAHAERDARAQSPPTTSCARSTASASQISASIPMRPARAPASSSPSPCRSASTSRLSSRCAGQDKPALSVDDQQICVEGLKHGETYSHHAPRRACPRRSTRPCSRTPSSTSMCATAARRCASPARPMCCRRPASRASRSSPSIPTRSKSRSTGSATATCSTTCSAGDFERNLHSYDSRRDRRREGREGLDRRAQGREGAERRDHHRLPRHRGGAHARAWRLSCSPPQPGNVAGDDYGERTTQWFIVSDLGLTAYLRHRRHPCLHQFARDHGAARRRRAAPARAQQRGAGGEEDRRRRHRDFRAGACPRRRRPVAGHARRLGDERRLCLPQSEAVGVRSDRPRRRRARRSARPRCFRLHRARRLPHRRDGACDDAAARRRRRRRSRRDR